MRYRLTVVPPSGRHRYRGAGIAIERALQSFLLLETCSARWSGSVLEPSVIVHKRRGRGVRYFRGAVYLAARRDRGKPCGSKPRGPIPIGVVAFQKPDFVLCHVRRVKPAVVWIVLYRVSLADAVAKDKVRGHKVVRICAPGIAHRQRRVTNGALKRPPDIDNWQSAFEGGFPLSAPRRSRTRCGPDFSV